ncbi:OTU domain-containing protein 4 [Pempheris klunzingeri]|uniref:OTU domain-containing protein 4 n=1 Tax=Pempheris klunzingeri TaxID=3127111 RepID=UPI00397EDD7C
MDGGMQSNEERGAEKLMDDHLKSLGLHRKKIAKDGSCLFRAVAEQVLHCQSLHTKVRAKCVEFLKQNRDSYEAFIEGNFEDYLRKLQDPQQWVGEVEINALAVMYKRDFLIYQEPGKPPVHITDNNFKDKVRLCFLNGNHYDSVYPVSSIKNAALCQSILYELLYDGVFKADRSLMGLCQRVSRPTDVLSDDNLAACPSSDESDLDVDEALWVENGTSTTAAKHHSYRGRGRGRPLPERVRRSLNPTLFRNIDYDVWHKTKRAQQKMDYCIAAGMQFSAGDRCQVRLEGGGRSYNATIKEVPPNDGTVTVYIEELGRKQVPLWSVRPPNNENSWSTVVNRDKRLSNGHGEWDDKGKGRGRGKHAPASSSVSLATAAGSSGRVLKQHSWPPQATVEEQGGTKASRKSVSLVEAAFGLTEKDLLAKEEEERNVALVEIQLRDEHSFPALGTQPGMAADGGRRKGGEKRRSQRNKTKSPVEDVGAASPSAGDRPASSTPPPPPPAPSATTAAPSVNTTTPAGATLPAAKPPSATPNTNIAASAAAAATASSPPLACDAPAPKTNTPGYAGATPSSPPHPPLPPAAAPTTKPSVPSSAALFVTPVLPSASSPPTPHALSSSSPAPSSSSKLPTSSSSSSLPPKSSASPPPPSSLPPPTFIAPIAPSPAAAAQSFHPPSSLPRSSPPVSSLPHSPSPPSFASSSSSSSLVHPGVHEAPPARTQTPTSLPNIGASQAPLSQIHPQVNQTQTQALLAQEEIHPQPPQPGNQILMLQMQSDAQSCPPHLQHHPHSDVAPLPQTQLSVCHLQPQSEVALHPAPGASYPHTSLTHPSIHSQTPSTQNQTEAPLPPAQPRPASPTPAPSQQSHPPHPSHHPQLQSAHPLPPPPPPHPHSLPGAVPLQQLSQLYQDPLYPGFPQGERGDMVPNPPLSSSKSGDDLPQDINILRFFFNLGVKAYSMPMFPPYVYLLPLQQAHTMHPKPPSRSPSPTPLYAPSKPPARHQEAYPQHPQYPPTSTTMPPQYDHQAPLAEPPHPDDSSFSQAGYSVTQPPPHRVSLPWQQHQMPPPRNPNFLVGYHAPSPPYSVPPPVTQGYHPGQGPGGRQLYPQSVPPYPPSTLGYQPSSTPEELQASQGPMEPRQPANGDAMPGRVPGPLESPAAANVANANANRPVVVPSFVLKKEQGESLTRAVLLVDPPLNNTPIITLVHNADVQDVPVSVTTMTPSSTPGSPSPRYNIISKTTVPGDGNVASRGYRSSRKPLNPTKPYAPLVPPEPGQVSYLATVAMAEALSVGCNTEDNWEEPAGFKPTTFNHRVPRRNHRGGGGGRGRGGHDPARGGQRRRHGGEAGFNYVQYNRGRGHERGY